MSLRLIAILKWEQARGNNPAKEKGRREGRECSGLLLIRGCLLVSQTPYHKQQQQQQQVAVVGGRVFRKEFYILHVF
jgi:hypothetical protein